MIFCREDMALQTYYPTLKNSVYTGCQTLRNVGTFSFISAKYFLIRNRSLITICLV